MHLGICLVLLKRSVFAFSNLSDVNSNKNPFGLDFSCQDLWLLTLCPIFRQFLSVHERSRGSDPKNTMPAVDPVIGRFLGGGFKYVLFSPLPGEDSHFDEHIFQMG